MLLQYLPLIIMLLLGFVVALGFLIFSEWLGARRAAWGKDTTYESGMVPYKTARERFTVKFYMVAVSFIIFDIEVIFMFPWAVRMAELGGPALAAMILFIVILLIGLIWEIKKGGLDWD